MGPSRRLILPMLAALALRASGQDAPAPSAAAERLLAAGVGELIFVRRHTLTANHVYSEHVNSRWLPGGGLCILDLRSGRVRDLVPELSSGVVNRFDLSFDARRIVFDYKRSALEGYRIYEVGVDGKGLRQLTRPETDEAALARRYGRGGYAHGTDDMHPCWLPDGGIVFSSTRVRRSVLCDSSDGFTTSVLHRMDADGGNLRPLSANSVSEFSPAVLPDGRILYMRWEYNRKGAGAVKCLWSMLPDGSRAEEVYGNSIVDPETMIYGRPVPGSPGKIVFLGASHWGPNNAMGTVILLDTARDPQRREAMRLISSDVDAQAHDGFHFQVDGRWVHDRTGTLGRLFKDPYPIDEDCYLVAHKPKGPAWDDPKAYDLAVLDGRGGLLPLFRDPAISCWHPYPLKPRPVPPVPSGAPPRADLAERRLAQCILGDVYAGLEGIPRGTVKYLRILEQTPRPWAARNRWAGDQEALAHSVLGKGLLGMQAQHGVVPVEEDGSANFLVPAGRNIYFQALDADYMALQTERTYVNYRAGEVRSCVGCHDRRRTPAPSSRALLRAPSPPQAQPGDEAPEKLIDYARQIQPVWDRHCTGCHRPEGKAAKLDLGGADTRLYSRSYESLLGLDPDKARRPVLPLAGLQVDENDVRAWVEPTPPRHFGAHSSLLAALLGGFEPRFESWGGRAGAMLARAKELKALHPELRVSREEFVRVVNWLDAGCQFHPSYWGMKNLSHRTSPYYRPPVTFQEAIGEVWPESLRGLYAADPR